MKVITKGGDGFWIPLGRQKLRKMAINGPPRLSETDPPFGSLYPLIQAELDLANGIRRARILTVEDIRDAYGMLQDDPWHDVWKVATDGRGWGWNAARTTLALMVRLPDGGARLGIGSCPAYRASPGMVWPELAPWPLGTYLVEPHEKKLKAWSESKWLIRLPPQMKNFLKTEMFLVF